MDSDDVRMIGIRGMGGGGKTTLARAVFDHISAWFEGKSFVENVREVSKGSFSGLKELQKKVLSDVLNDQSIVAHNISDLENMMKKMMRGRKVLVVLDDVDGIDQLEALAGELTWFKPGSRIIITTRDEQVLVAHGVHGDDIHDVNLLSHEEAICLFSRYAFKRETPNQGYEDLSGKVVHYAAGLPLTIKVLGSHLCSRTKNEWVDAIERLKTIPLEKTLKRLELSYNGLEDDQKEIFLDIACILKGETYKRAVRILESCGFYAQIGLRVLEQKSLINISRAKVGFLDNYYYGTFGDDEDYFDKLLFLHDRIEEMGRNIVWRLHRDKPYKRSRLWIRKEIEDILFNNSGTEAIRSIKLWYSQLHPALIMKGLRNMNQLRVLLVRNGCGEWIINEVGEYLPNSLRCLYWDCYPFWCLPYKFQANELVILEMPNSNISQLWGVGERKVLNGLKFVNLRRSKLETFDVKMTPNLEWLDLRHCENFAELHMPDECPKLTFLDLSYSKLRTIELGLTPCLERLDLGHCEDLVELHMSDECPKLTYLDLSYSKLRTFDLGLTPCLKSLGLGRCIDFVDLHIPVNYPKLEYINLLDTKVSNLNLELTPHLVSLDLRTKFGFIEVHMHVECPKLKSLKLYKSKVSRLDLGLTPNIEELETIECDELVELHMPVKCLKLKNLKLVNSKVSNLNLGLTPNIERLNVVKGDEIFELHMSIELPRLKELNLRGSKLSNLNLGSTANLEDLDLSNCNEFVNLYIPVKLTKLEFLTLNGTKLSSINLGMTPNLKILKLQECNDLVELHIVECPKLKHIILSCSKVRNLNLGITPNLEVLELGGCDDLVELHMPIDLPKLQVLNLSGSELSNLKLNQTPNLKTLSFEDCSDFVELDMSSKCPMLKFLNQNCSKLDNLNLGMTPHLEKYLHPSKCFNLQEANFHMGCLKKLAHLNLCGCLRFEDFVVAKRYELSGLDSVATTLELIAESLEKCPLHPDNNFPKIQFRCVYDELLPSSSRNNIEKLIFLGLCGVPCLGNLALEGGIPKVLGDLYSLQCLQKLTLRLKEIKHLPDSICMLKYLKSLELKSCWLLEKLPKGLYRLECLEKLHVVDCISLRDIPKSICMIKCLKYLSIKGCAGVRKLPEEIGRLACLEVLDIEGTCILYLPRSIFQLVGLEITGSRLMLQSNGLATYGTQRNTARVRSCFDGAGQKQKRLMLQSYGLAT